MKGVYPDEELAQLPPEVTVRAVVPLKVPGLPAQRHLVVMEVA
jgi:16S rRNA (guanine527-N7)-methyltransferase